MVARMWRGWVAADNADEVAARLGEGALARYRSAPGNVSASVLVRSQGGGVEIVTLTMWESDADVPAGVEEDHRLLVARQTVPDRWHVAPERQAVVRAA